MTTPVSPPGYPVQNTDHIGFATGFWNGTTDCVNAMSYGADPTGTFDSSAAINLALASCKIGQTVVLSAGTYLISSPIQINNPGVGLVSLGGPLGTVIQGNFFYPINSYLLYVNAPSATVSGITFRGFTTITTGNVAAHAIYMNAQRNVQVSWCNFENINGYMIYSLATAANAGFATMINNISSFKNCAGGIFLKSVTGITYGGQYFLNNINTQQVGVTSGTWANQDAIHLEDIFDILIENWNGAVMNTTTGATLNVVGNCAAIYITNPDIGVSFSSAGETCETVRFQASGGNAPRSVCIMGGIIQAGMNNINVMAGVDIKFIGVDIKNAQGTGFVCSSNNSKDINLIGCVFGNNGVSQTGTNYEFNWSGTSQGSILNCFSESPIVASGSAVGVQNIGTVNGAANLTVDNMRISGSGVTVSNVFPSGALSPQTSRHIDFWNPRGQQTVAVPASAGSTPAAAVDRFYYINTTTSTVTVSVSGGGLAFSITIPTNTTNFPLFVPQGSTLTPTYTTAPTWTVMSL